MNIASALTGGFAKDIKVDLDTINLGNQLLFMAIVIFEIPCNMALQKVDITRDNWGLAGADSGRLARENGLQVRCLPLASSHHSKSSSGDAPASSSPGWFWDSASRGTFLVPYTRMVCEAGAGQASCHPVFFGMFGANALSPPITSGILKLHDKGGLSGWQWIFLCRSTYVKTRRE
jgi:hypothetical protein